MRGFIIAGLLLGAELTGCGALVSLPPETGDAPAQPSENDAIAPPPVTADRRPDAGLDVRPVEASVALDAYTSDVVDAPTADEREVVDAPAPATSCPAMPPSVGDPCALPDSGVLRCEYSYLSGPCLTLAYCDGQRWGHGLEIPADASSCD